MTTFNPTTVFVWLWIVVVPIAFPATHADEPKTVR